MELSDFKPISSYGLIGNCRSAALVCRGGSIDWCCFPHLDRASVFGALLDRKKGGRFSIRPVNAGHGKQYYLPDTNVLTTEIEGQNSLIAVTDFMPIEGYIHGKAQTRALPEIHRIVECKEGETEVNLEWSPRFDYARAEMNLYPIEGGFAAEGGGEIISLSGVDNGEITDDGYGPVLRAKIPMRKGQRCAVVCRWNSVNTVCSIENSNFKLQRTTEIWKEWAHRQDVIENLKCEQKWLPGVIRSQLVLKLLSHSDTGAIAAAPTTSLPEEIGGVRNWDYRYAWIRDASQTAQALIAVGHVREAFELLDWMERVSADHAGKLQIMYGLHGEANLDEYELPHLSGYRQSRPVNIGNDAASQLQLEVFGELINMGYELARRGHIPEPRILQFLSGIADTVVEIWDKPDHGIWEMRGAPRHFTYSKIMCWVALDRAIHLSKEFGMPGAPQLWYSTMQKIHKDVLEHGYNKKIEAFTMCYDCEDLDAANLRIPMMEFLPFNDPRVQSTIDRTMEKLMHNCFVHRYLMDDGLPGEEGAFGLCTFWLVDALALSNRLDEAREIFDKLLAHSNHLGLFPEEFNPVTGEFLGNYPQAFSHVGLINSVLNITYAQGRRVPDILIGTPEHRRRMGRDE
ncbi:Glucoamylase [Chitinispirillum alkaliphilum]|nr:Glucoamylase [Chitinispirillum alkaliphilum]